MSTNQRKSRLPSAFQTQATLDRHVPDYREEREAFTDALRTPMRDLRKIGL